jgi:hypothetical protein
MSESESEEQTRQKEIELKTPNEKEEKENTTESSEIETSPEVRFRVQSDNTQTTTTTAETPVCSTETVDTTEKSVVNTAQTVTAEKPVDRTVTAEMPAVSDTAAMPEVTPSVHRKQHSAESSSNVDRGQVTFDESTLKILSDVKHLLTDKREEKHRRKQRMTNKTNNKYGRLAQSKYIDYGTPWGSGSNDRDHYANTPRMSSERVDLNNDKSYKPKQMSFSDDEGELTQRE